MSGPCEYFPRQSERDRNPFIMIGWIWGLVVTVSVPNEIATPLAMTQTSPAFNDEVVLRRFGGKAITSLDIYHGACTVDGPSPPRCGLEFRSHEEGTSKLGEATNCDVKMKIVWNEVDVDSKSQAEYILGQFLKDVERQKQLSDAYGQIVSMSSAYEFMKTVADNFRSQVSNESMETLRQRIPETARLLEIAGQGCPAPLTARECDAIPEILLSLGALGAPGEHLRPDGSPKSLDDYFGPQVLPLIHRMAEQATPSVVDANKKRYQDAAFALAEAQSRLAQARVELAKWIP